MVNTMRNVFLYLYIFISLYLYIFIFLYFYIFIFLYFYIYNINYNVFLLQLPLFIETPLFFLSFNRFRYNNYSEGVFIYKKKSTTIRILIDYTHFISFIRLHLLFLLQLYFCRKKKTPTHTISSTHSHLYLYMIHQEHQVCINTFILDPRILFYCPLLAERYILSNKNDQYTQDLIIL